MPSPYCNTSLYLLCCNLGKLCQDGLRCCWAGLGLLCSIVYQEEFIDIDFVFALICKSISHVPHFSFSHYGNFLSVCRADCVLLLQLPSGVRFSIDSSSCQILNNVSFGTSYHFAIQIVAPRTVTTDSTSFLLIMKNLR